MDAQLANLAVSGVLGLLAYSLKLNLSSAERRITSLENDTKAQSGHINGILVTLAASTARQEELSKRLEEVSSALADNTRAMTDLSHKLVEVSVRTEL